MRQNRSLAQAFTPGSARYSLLSPSAGARLFSLPAHTVFRVLKNNSTLGQLITNFVCTIEVAAMARFLPLVDQPLYFVIEHLCLRPGKNIEHAVKATDRADNFVLIIPEERSSGQSLIHFAC